MSEQADRVRQHTADQVNEELDEQRVRDVARYADASPAEVTRRIAELDREWDVERVLEANAATLMLLSLGLSRVHSRRWLALSAVVPTFLLQHAVQGWCPPIEVFRRMGVRTRREIDAERAALKALRGDFGDLDATSGSAEDRARAALEAARETGRA